MGDGLCRSHFILGKASAGVLLPKDGGKLCWNRELPPSKQILQSAPEAPGRTLLPALRPVWNSLPKHPRTSSGHAEGIKPALRKKQEEGSEQEGPPCAPHGEGTPGESRVVGDSPGEPPPPLPSLGIPPPGCPPTPEHPPQHPPCSPAGRAECGHLGRGAGVSLLHLAGMAVASYLYPNPCSVSCQPPACSPRCPPAVPALQTPRLPSI